MLRTFDVQSHEGHTTVELTKTGKRGDPALTDEEVRAKFQELVDGGYLAFSETKLDGATQVKSLDEVRDTDTETLFFIAPLVGG